MSKPISFLAAAVLLGYVAFAQTPDSSASAPAPTPAPNPPAASQPSTPQNDDRRDVVEGRLRRMSKELNLTDDQKEKLKPVLQQEADQIKALQADSSLTPQQRRKKVREIHKTFQPQVQALLTPEQKAKLKDMQGDSRQRRRNRRRGNSAPDDSDTGGAP